MDNLKFRAWLEKEKKMVDWHNNPMIKINIEREDKDNIFCPPLEADKALEILTDYLLGEDWYVVDPIGAKQVNYRIVEGILLTYSKRFKEEYEQYNKEKEND